MPDPISIEIEKTRQALDNHPLLRAPSNKDWEKLSKKPPLTEKQVKEKASKQGPITFPAKIPSGELFEKEDLFKRHEDKYVYLIMTKIPPGDIASFMSAFQDQYLKQCIERKRGMEKMLGQKVNHFDSLNINFEVEENHRIKFLNELLLPHNTQVSLQGQVQNSDKISVALVFQKPPAENITDTIAYVNTPDPSKPKEISINISPEGKRIQESWKAEVLKYQKQMREFNAELASLEKLALNTHANLPKPALRETPSASIQGYSFGLMGFDFEAFIEKVRTDFDLPKIAVANIGGSIGTAAFEVQRNNPNIQTFVIDPTYSTPKDPSIYPPQNRFFVNKIENSVIPDNSFHALISYNTLPYTDVNKSIQEIYRILKPSGSAALDYDLWNTNHADLEALPKHIKDNLKMEYRSMQINELGKSKTDGPFGPFDFKSIMEIRSENLHNFSFVKNQEKLGVKKIEQIRRIIDKKAQSNGDKKLFAVFILTKPIDTKQEAEAK